MTTDTRNGAWDHSVKLVVVGSGAGAMTAGICAHDRGGAPLLIGKTPLYGGSSAMSGGSLWIPNNHPMAAAGVNDSPADALTYPGAGGTMGPAMMFAYILACELIGN